MVDQEVEAMINLKDSMVVDVAVNNKAKKSYRHSHTSSFGDLTVRDDPTLSNPSSALIFTNNETKVFTVGQSQIILEKDPGSNEITAKQVGESTPGLFLIRAAYTLVAFLMSGFLFVFCVQLVLFLFLGLSIESGLTSSDEAFTFLVFMGTLFAIPAYLYAMANMMTIAMAFTADTWNGQKFMKTIMSWDSVVMDWLATSVYVFVPFIVGAISLFARQDDWWDKILISWFTCVFLFFLLFAACTIYHEIDGCLQLIRYSPKTKEKYPEGAGRLNMQTIKAAFLMKMRHKLAGTKLVKYNAHGYDPKAGEMSLEELKAKRTENGLQQSKGPLTRLGECLMCCGLYRRIDPTRYYSVDEVRGQSTFLTNSTWGLESIYCRNREKRFIAVVQGESSLTKSQVLSSFLCFSIGIVFTLFVFISFMVWFHLPPGAIGVVCVFYILWCFQSVRGSLGLKHVYQKLQEEVNVSDESEVLYQVSETFKITEPTEKLCWIVLFLEILMLFVLPAGALFHGGNLPIGILFIFVTIVTFSRRYCNSTIVVQEYGTLDGIELDNFMRDKSAAAMDEEWREKHRLGMIMSEISSGRKNDFWMGVFIFFVIAFCGVFMSAVVAGANEGAIEELELTSAFSYAGFKNMEYTSCRLQQGIIPPDTAKTALADFTLLAKAAYLTNEAANTTLQKWFDETIVEVETQIVQNFRDNYEEKNGKSPVEYKFFGFPANSVGVVSIRGTVTGWDALSDVQLWSAAALGQWIRAIMPLGGLFTPVLQYLVEIVSLIESHHLDEVAFYKQTSAFVEHVKTQAYEEGNKYDNIIVNGHSLGGGLAMISGAQRQVPAVALSGPNAVLSRRTFSPAVSRADLEAYTFNIVPDRDIVPRLDDLSQNYQRIKCRTGLNDPISCHFATRSLCEIILSCGSGGRPVPCECLQIESIYVDSIAGGGPDEATISDACK